MKRTGIAAGVAAISAIIVLFVVIRQGDDQPTRPEPEVKGTGEVVQKRMPRAGQDARGTPTDTRVLVDDDPEGALRLEGLVLDAADKPVGGAAVFVDTNPPREVVTEADGSFFVDKLVARPYRLVARAAAGIAGPVTARLTETNDPVVLKLRPASSVEVTVVDARTRAPVANASVEVRSIATLTATTGSDGVALITGVVPGRQSIVAHAPGYAKQHARVRAIGTDTPVSVRLELRAGAAVSGRVVTDDGTPVGGASVRYQGASEWALQADPRRDAVISEKDGTFSFDALPAGTFRFTASQHKYAPGLSEMVTLDGQSAVEGVKVVLEPGATLRGVVVDKSGDPVSAARVRVRVRSERMRWRGDVRQAYADDEGKYLIEGLMRRPLEVVAVHESAASEMVEVDMSEPPSDRELMLTLDVDGKIAGIVVDEAGEPVEGAQVWAWPDFSSRRGARRAMRGMMSLRGRPQELTDAGGRFDISGLDPGEYMLRASRSSAGRGRGWFREPTGAKTGDTDVRIELGKDGGIKGKVVFKNGDAPALFSVGVGWRGGTPFSSKDGSFELTDLPPRSYTLRISGAGFDKKQVPDVEVKKAKITDLGTVYVAKGRTISGRVTQDGSPVEGALVRAGRVLFGDGSSSKASGGGPPQARSAKETRTDEDGAFTIYGIGLGDISVVAEHDVEGRSQAIYIPKTGQSITNVELALSGYGALEGIVTRGGQPVPDVIVNAASLTSPSVSFGVSAGPDGKFRFDRLAPDSYKVSAMIGRNPMAGFGYHPTLAEVVSGETASVSLSIAAGAVSLTVTLQAEGGADMNFSQVYVVRAPVSSGSARDVTLAIGRLGDAQYVRALSIRGNPAAAPGLEAGAYSVCAIPYPLEVRGMAGTMDYMERAGDDLPAYCEPITLAESPAEQSMLMKVTLPEYVPPPAADQLE